MFAVEALLCHHKRMTEIRLPYAGQEDDEKSAQSWRSRLSANIPALIGFVILVIVVIWGLVHLVALMRPWFSSLAPTTPKVTITQPTSPSTTFPKPVIGAPVRPGTQTAKPSAGAGTPTTPPDLSVRILAIGVIDPVSGVFVNRPPVSPADVAAVQFDISNDGGSSTGAWYFSAQLPTTVRGYPYRSPVQEPLGPGDQIVNTLRFSPVIPGGGVFNVIIDSEGMVDESNETNNTATQFVPMMVY